MKAEELMKLDPTLSPEDAIYYERSEMKTPYEIEQIERELSDVKAQIKDIADIWDYINFTDNTNSEPDSWLDTLDSLKEDLLRRKQRLQIKLKVTRRKMQESGVKY